MNIQTERIEETHSARLTVEVGEKRWSDAKNRAAADLSGRYKIPGFRKGKAPYSIVVRYLGESPIVESAIELLGNEVYKDALAESGVEPYTSGSLEDFKLEPEPTYIFSVPLQPEAKLGDDYTSIRLEYTAPIVKEDDVDRAVRGMLQREATVEDSDQPVAVGNRVTADIHSHFADGEERSEDEDEEAPRAEGEAPKKGDNFFHRHDAILNLDPLAEPVLPGFINAMIGATVDETREFDLSVPTDDEDYKNIEGRLVHFEVTVKKIQSVTLPELNDEFAAKVTEDEDQPLTLAQLRERVQNDLTAEAQKRADNDFANRVLDKIVEGATASYHEATLTDRIHELLDDLDKTLRQQGMSLESYQKITGTTHEELHEQYHDEAVKSLKRTLVLGEILKQHNVTVTDAEIDAEINKTLAQFGEQAAALRQFIDTPQQRASIANNVLFQNVMSLIAKIGKGESLAPVTEAAPEASETTQDETAPQIDSDTQE